MHNVWFKNLWNWLCNIDLMIFDLLAPPQGPRGLGPKQWCHSMWHSCKYLIHQIWLNFGIFLTPQPPKVPSSPTPGVWARRPNENPVWYVLYLSFVRRHTKFGFKNFEIDFVLEILWYLMILNFWSLPRAPGGRAKNVPLCMWVTHTPNLVGFRPMV